MKEQRDKSSVSVFDVEDRELEVFNFVGDLSCYLGLDGVKVYSKANGYTSVVVNADTSADCRRLEYVFLECLRSEVERCRAACPVWIVQFVERNFGRKRK